MNARSMEERRNAEIQDLAEKSRRARRLAATMTDLAVRGSLLEFAVECDARTAEITGADDPGQTA